MKTTSTTFCLLKAFFFCSLLLSLNACTKDMGEDEDDDASGSGSGGGGSTTGNYWQRNDGQATAYISFSGTVAQSCANGVVTTGTYNASEPSMTFVIQGNTIKFPLKFSNNTLMVGVPDQAVNTNTATQYIKSSSFPCNGGSGSGSGNGSGSGGGSTIPKRGTFKVRVYKPTGDCASNSSWGQGSAFNGTMNAELYKADGTFQSYQNFVSSYGPSNNSTNTYWDYTTSNSAVKLNWDLFPNKSSWPTRCSQKGSSTIEYDGQVKQITIMFQ
jgi:hypothetical protein